ncbi:MAG: anti-sigma factor [Chloroflexota bacterium]|nr:anti-sigma factor [Chloroflexota bacterium]MDE2884243.1 anti-sigma factor [Chloroflexota bacterium]
MFIRRKLSISVALVLTLSLLMSLSASAREPALGGAASFRDANASSDSLVVDFTDATTLSHGSTYEGWLIDADDNKLSTGTLGRGPYLQGEYVSPTGDDLLARYGTFVITVEPLDDPDPGPSGVIAYGAATRGAVLSHIVELVGEDGAATALRDQAASALAYAEAAYEADSLADTQASAAMAAGMVSGIVAQARASADVAGDLLFSAASGDDENVDGTANDLIDATNNVIRLAGEMRDAAARVAAAAGSDVATKVETENLYLWANRLLNGTVEDSEAQGDPSSGGAIAVYEAAQDLGAFRPGVGAPPATGDSLVPMVALLALVLGAAFVLSGGLMVFRSRRRAFA